MIVQMNDCLQLFIIMYNNQFYKSMIEPSFYNYSVIEGLWRLLQIEKNCNKHQKVH